MNSVLDKNGRLDTNQELNNGMFENEVYEIVSKYFESPNFLPVCKLSIDICLAIGFKRPETQLFYENGISRLPQ